MKNTKTFLHAACDLPKAKSSCSSPRRPYMDVSKNSSGLLAARKRFRRLTLPNPPTRPSQPTRPCSAHCVPSRISFASLVVHKLSGEVPSLFGQDPVAPERRKNGNEDELARKRNGGKISAPYSGDERENARRHS